MGIFSFGVKQAPLVLTTEVLMGSVYQAFASTNERIPFSPAIAAWIFVAGVINLCWPKLVYKYLKWRKLRRSLRSVLRFLVPWLAFHLVWVPFNQTLCNIVGRMTLFEPCSRAGWLPYISLVAAVAFFVWSIRQSGVVDYVTNAANHPGLLHAASLMSLCVRPEEVVPPVKRSPGKEKLAKVTRSGRKYGGWHRNSGTVRLTRRGTIYNEL